MFEVNNRNTRKRCEICSQVTIKTAERRLWRRSGVFIVNFEHISRLFLVFPLLTLIKLMLAGQPIYPPFVNRCSGLIWPKNYWEFRDEVGTHNLAERISVILTRKLQILSERLYHCVALPIMSWSSCNAVIWYRECIQNYNIGMCLIQVQNSTF